MKKTNIFGLIFSFFAFLGAAQADDLLPCDDERVIGLVKEQIQEMKAKEEKDTLLNIRFYELITKYAKNMAEVDLKTFAPEEEYVMADKVMELKMNKNQDIADMRLCKVVYNGVKNRIYVLLYHDGEEEKAYIYTVVADKQKKAEKTISKAE